MRWPPHRHCGVLCRARVAIISVIVFAASSAVATAESLAYVGTWGADPAQCALAQDAEGAPYVFGPNRYDQHEAHCAFKSISKPPTPQTNSWVVAAECLVEGDMQTQDFTLIVEGDTLTWADSSGALDLMRCK